MPSHGQFDSCLTDDTLQYNTIIVDVPFVTSESEVRVRVHVPGSSLCDPIQSNPAQLLANPTEPNSIEISTQPNPTQPNGTMVSYLAWTKKQRLEHNGLDKCLDETRDQDTTIETKTRQ